MILITGATGLSGHFVALELLRRGYAVRGLARASSADKLVALGVDVAIGDLTDPDSLRRACDGVDGIVHAACTDRGRFYCQTWRYDDRTLRQALAFQPGWTWQQTVAASVALAADD